MRLNGKLKLIKTKIDQKIIKQTPILSRKKKISHPYQKTVIYP